ncbi:MAG: hypothetical protein CL610_01605 [Anaerolineaceae bacterium]|nr:hypothetical protein [Anaerolineaceae bacterium]
MTREPDWETLSEINFLISRRMLEQLTTAANALKQDESESPNQIRASSAVGSALDLYGAWVDLIRHNTGESRLHTHQSKFSGRDMLEWVAATLQLGDLPEPDDDILRGNRAIFQEALLLLQSCAHTLGPGVRVRVEKHRHGLWFRVRYARTGEPPATLDELLASLNANWRLQSAAFELRCARDFLSMCTTDLFYTLHESECELAFFAWYAQQPTNQPGPKEKAKALLDSYNTDDTYRVITDS